MLEPQSRSALVVQGFHHGTEIRPEQVTPPVRRALVMIDVVRPLALSAAALAASTSEFAP